MKRILIIGATSTIARACIRRWAKQECHFFLVGRSIDRLSDTASDLRVRTTHPVSTYVLDVTQTSLHAQMLEHCLDAMGGIDIALIAHGSLPDQAACALDTEQCLQAIAENGTSTVALVNRLARALKQQGSGTLAVISSVAGDRGRPSNYVYGSAKALVSSYCEGLGAELFDSGINVLVVKPGFVDTPMTQDLDLPAAMVASPDQIAGSILRAIAKRKSVAYTPSYWGLIMFIIRHIPEFIFKKMKL